MRRSSMVVLLLVSFGVQTAGADGKATYDSACGVCHTAGVAGAPKLGDKDAWAGRIEQGMDVLVKHAVEGYTGEAGVMPPKGGFMHLSDEEVTDAVQYMVDNSQ